MQRYWTALISAMILGIFYYIRNTDLTETYLFAVVFLLPIL